MFDKVREAHHEIMEHVGSHIDAGNYLLVYQGFLELVRLLVGFFYGELFDLCQLAREAFVKLCWGWLSGPSSLGPHEGSHVLGQALPSTAST